MRKEDIRILIACEESQAVCKAFRERGFTAFSCDIQECSGGHPEWHIKGDVLNVLNDSWTMVIGHPPCTYLAISGNRAMQEQGLPRLIDRADAIKFFGQIYYCNAKFVAVENPVGIMSSVLRPADQYIQPWMFGDMHRKRTGLWIRNLPLLKPEITEEPQEVRDNLFYFLGRDGRYWSMDAEYADASGLPADERRRRRRSKTYPGIARAIAEQWGEFMLNWEV